MIKTIKKFNNLNYYVMINKNKLWVINKKKLIIKRKLMNNRRWYNLLNYNQKWIKLDKTLPANKKKIKINKSKLIMKI